MLRVLETASTPRGVERRGRGLDLLVLAMLSQNTNMANARNGFAQLRRAFDGSWERVMDAPVADVQRHIAVCGLARMRARRLQALLRTIKERHGKLCLQFLRRQTPAEAMDYLLGYFGIGPKTAAYTLLFAFDMPVFPVDKGIHRMCRRMGLVRAKAGEAETERAMEQMVPPGKCRPMHRMMFAHAKSVCRPRNPKCGQCPALAICPHGQRRIKHRPPEKDVELPADGMRPIILSRYVSDGLAKAADAEPGRRRIG